MMLPCAAFFLGFLALSACERAEAPVSEPQKPVRLFIEGTQPVPEDETRTEWTGSTLNWSESDVIALTYSLDGKWEADLFASDPLAESAASASFSVSATAAGAGTYDFRTVYPEEAVSEYAGGRAVVEIPATQTPQRIGSHLSFDPAADLLWGRSTSTYGSFPDGTAVPIVWKRLVAHACITLKNLPATLTSETIEQITLRAQEGAALAGQWSLSVDGGSLTPLETTETLILSPDNLTLSGSNLEFWAAMMPGTVSALTVSVTTDKAIYTRSISDLSLNFLQNRRNTLGVNMASATRSEFAYTLVSEAPADWSGDYLLGYGENFFAGKADGGNYGAFTTLTVTDGAVPYSAGVDYNLKIARRESGNYSLLYGTQYLGYAVSGNAISFSEKPDNWTQYEWTITLEGTVVKIVNAASTSRRIQWNPASNALRFSTYTGSQKDPSLYRLNREAGEGGDPVTPPDPPVPPTPPTPSDQPGYLGCFEVPAIPTLTGQSAKGTNSDKGDTWYGYYTTNENRRVATHTFAHPDKSNKQTRNYTVMFDGSTRAPVWTAHAMHSDMWPDHNVGRNDSWKSDPAFSGLTQQNGVSGYSRGHLVASNYRQSTTLQNKQTFYLTNQAPQWQTSFNDGVWNQLEQAVAGHTPSGRDTLYVVIGVLYEGTTKYVDDVPIPSHFYKCLMECWFDSTGAMTNAAGVAYIFTNEAHKGMKYSEGATTIDAIEERAGFDFFPQVPEAFQTAAESSTTALW